jgi:protein involved in ribonucleotide reduction
MLPRDELRQSLLEAIKKVEILCQDFGYKPATDLRHLVTEVVQKADESRSITKPVVHVTFDNPYVVWGQQYEAMHEQFKQKYVDIIKQYAIPAIKKYFDTHPRVDLTLFEPLINIKIVGSVVTAGNREHDDKYKYAAQGIGKYRSMMFPKIRMYMEQKDYLRAANFISFLANELREFSEYKGTENLVKDLLKGLQEFAEKLPDTVQHKVKLTGGFMQNVKVGQTIIVQADSPSRPKDEDTNASAWMYHMLQRNTWKIAYRGYKLLKMSREDLAKTRFERDNVPDAQDFISGKPMEAFTTFMKTSPRRDVKPLSFVEPFIIAVALLTGHEMAAIIFQKYFMKRAGVKEAMERSEVYQKGEESLMSDQLDSMTDALKKEFGSYFFPEVVTMRPGTVAPVPYEFSIAQQVPGAKDASGFRQNSQVKFPYKFKYDGEWRLMMAAYPQHVFGNGADLITWLHNDLTVQADRVRKERKRMTK